MTPKTFTDRTQATVAASEPMPQPSGVSYYQDTATRPHYCVIRFDAQPDEAIRKWIRKSGWRWSPARNAWTRPLTLNGIASARQVLQEISRKENNASHSESQRTATQPT